MRIVVRLGLTFFFFFLAAGFEGTIWREIFAVIGFWAFSGIFRRQGGPGAPDATIPPSTPWPAGAPRPPLAPNAVPGPVPASAPPRRWALPLLACLGLVALLAVIVWRSGEAGSRQRELPDDEPARQAAPSVAERLFPEDWDQSRCLAEKYPILVQGPKKFSPEITQNTGWQRGEYLTGLSCAFEWDEDAVARQVEVLRSHGLLASQWNAETIAQARQLLEQSPELRPGTEAPLPEDLADLAGHRFGDLSRLTEGLALAVLEPELPAPLPDERSRSKARSELRISSTNLPLRHLRKLTINDSNPRVVLFTDLPDRMTLADLGSEAGQFLGRTFEKYNQRLDYQGGNGLPTLALAPDLFSRYLVGQLRAIVIAAQRNRPPGLPPLPDVAIIYLKQLPPAEVLGRSVHRTGLFRGDLGLVYVERKFTVSYHDGVHQIMSIVSADLLHELDHYFQFSPRLQDLPFLFEGQATFNGEEGMRPVLAAARYTSGAKLPEVLAKLDLPADDFNRFAGERLSREGMSENQRDILCHARSLIKQGRFSLEQLLSISPSRLVLMDDDYHRDFYSAAWATYGAVQQDRDWPARFTELAGAAARGSLTQAQRQELASLQAQVVTWSKRMAAKENLACRG